MSSSLAVELVVVPVNKSATERARRASAKRAGKNRTAGKGHPTTSDVEYSGEEIEFMTAIREFQNRTGKKFPTWSEVLRVVRSLGYARDFSSQLFDAPEDGGE